MAISKVAIPVVSAGLLLLALLLLGIYPPTHSRVLLNQLRVLQSLRDLNQAERQYAAMHPKAGFACDLSTLAEETSRPGSGAGLIDRVLGSGTKFHYQFEIHCQQSADRAVSAYTITAVPVSPGVTGDFALCTDQGGAVWHSENGSAAECLATRRPMPRGYR